MQKLLIGFIRVYQLALSPLLGARCRFYPSCSHYARAAIARHGALGGGWLAVRRVCKCHPLHAGGYDPVPARAANANSNETNNEVNNV